MNFLLKTLICICFVSFAWSKAIVDPSVAAALHSSQPQLKRLSAKQNAIPTIIFLKSESEASYFLNDLKRQRIIVIKKLNNLPAVLVLLPTEPCIVNYITNHPAVMQVSSLQRGHEEIELSEQAILLKSSNLYPDISNWWDNGYTGKNSIVGIIDSGVASEHTSLSQTKIITRKETGSGYNSYKNGLRSAHGTGVACVYAGSGNTAFPNDIGIAHGLSTILTGLAGVGDGKMDDLAQTFSTLDWMLNRGEGKPDLINYSFGNGLTNCKNCSDWSGLAKIVDYVVNHDHILWVKSAGNGGYVKSASKAPYVSTMTSPADNYNAITVANMNPTITYGNSLILNPNRDMHTIRYTSSRGPTLKGRKKPDISAPGNGTRTCAPDSNFYSFFYPKAADYHDGYRLMGGTSIATPHVGAAALLLREAGITSPMSIKAVLINSADAYTDNDKPGPDDPRYTYEDSHYPVQGSEWNRTYGWGYLNMQKAYDEQSNLIQDKLTIDNLEKLYEVNLPVGAKITLVHERRVGYSHSQEWQLSHLSLEIINQDSNQVFMKDDSIQDTVHQVANCQRHRGEKKCSPETRPMRALIKIKLLSPAIDGAKEEPYSLASSVPLWEK